MKKLFFLMLFAALTSVSFANHTKGGWMYYEYMGAGSAPNTLKYRITLKLYTICTLNPGQFNPTINFSIFAGATNQNISNVSVTFSDQVDIQNCNTQDCHPCINQIPTICYKITTYQTTIDLAITTSGYTVAYQRCCRITGINNIQAPSNSVGETWTVKIPGIAIPGAETNSSANFSQNDTAIICEGNSFIFDFSATDIDNDSLVYAFTPAFGGASNVDPAPANASNPPYTSVPYAFGYTGIRPMGNGVTINPATGIVTGIAPPSGIYVMTVTVSEYKRGTNIKVAEVRKSLHIEVANCSVNEAKLDPQYLSCDGFTLNFFNIGGGNIQTYYWDFGDGDTSTLQAPAHTYADTGVYTLKLVVNRGLLCSDSANSPVKVYPGFFPGFKAGGQCKNVPVQFTDTSTVRYGSIYKWTWNFGDPTSPNNTSILQNPTHIYSTAGTYTVTCLIESDKGCGGTVTRTVDILTQPPLTVTNDTLICIIDTLQLHAVGAGSVLWSPNYMINDVNSADPLVSPDVPTTYYITITDAFGCVGNDSVRVDVKSFVTQFAGPDTTICTADAAVLRLTSDALYYTWTENPPGGNTLNNPAIKNPTARPLVTTTYHVVGSIGKCIAEHDLKVTPVPYPAANAGPDNTICIGNSAQLNASGGSIYSWSPGIFLTATNIPNPVSVKPTDNVRYVVTVRDVRGCPKPVRDTMILFVSKIKANAGPRDTSVVLGQPLQLSASGGTNYLWTPITWLDNPSISNPVALPQNDIQYMVRVSDNFGCFDNDSIRVRVFKFKPDLLVPNAFTPNGNGDNDIFRPIPIGMKSVDIFRVYNRWGQMLYSGNGNGAGWDGTFGGKKQETATYVWYAEGTDYLNNKIKRKGSVILIR